MTKRFEEIDNLLNQLIEDDLLTEYLYSEAIAIVNKLKVNVKELCKEKDLFKSRIEFIRDLDQQIVELAEDEVNG